ncbi:MAG: PaaI family thioesterase [Acidobacteria bacterium]|nr:PaaI family thioesterase [Acidobacteriota bacterium]
MARPSNYLDALRARAAALPFFRLIGLEVVEMLPGRSVLAIRHRPDLAQPTGILHGGVTAALVDTGIAYAVLARDEIRSLVEAGGSVVAIDLRIKYFRPVAAGRLTCVSRVTRMGRRVIHGESIVTNEQDKEVARGDSIYGTVNANEMARHGAPSGTMHMMPEAVAHTVSEEGA